MKGTIRLVDTTFIVDNPPWKSSRCSIPSTTKLFMLHI